jgi:hypothetical protein
MVKQWSTWGFIVSLVLAAACWGLGAMMMIVRLQHAEASPTSEALPAR